VRGGCDGDMRLTDVRFTRTRRCAMVGSGTRNARAISSVVSQRRRSATTCASCASAGWQQVK
jgi:hypothetical protein